MKLRTKIFSIFAVALLINIFVIIIGLTAILDRLSSMMMMMKQAENLTQYLQHSIVEAEKQKNSDEQLNISIEKYFETAKHIADESKSFDLRKIL